MRGTAQEGLQEALDQELYKCFHRQRYVGLFMNFSNISFIAAESYRSLPIGNRVRRRQSGFLRQRICEEDDWTVYNKMASMHL